MTASSRGSRAVVSLIRSSRHPRVCSDCINSITRSLPITTRRSYAVAAPVLKTSDGIRTDPIIKDLPPVSPSSTSPEYITQAGIILSRPPLITRPQTSFENAFFLYQKRLNERLAMPFTRYFYFKKDTPGDVDWKLKAKDRKGVAAKEIGDYQAYGEHSWNDEVLVGEKIADPEYIRDALVKDSVLRTIEGQRAGDIVEGIKVEDPLPRVTEADKKNDVKRLDRKLERTLYLIIKREDGRWIFPSGSLNGRENLHQAAERILVQSAGADMNTWIVGHAPISHYVGQPKYNDKETRTEIVTPGEKTFFLKARILAGQANIEGNVFGATDYKWLTKEELGGVLHPRYYSWVRNALHDL